MKRQSGINPQTKSLETLAEEALKTNDGHRLRELISDIGSHTGDPILRARHLAAIVSRFPDASHIVTGTITTMVINQLPETRELIRGIIDAPSDRERDLIIARAASALLQVFPIEDQDVPRIAHALTRSLPAVRAEVARAITLLPSQHAATLLVQARGHAQTSPMQIFLRKLEELVTTPTVTLPPRPAAAAEEIDASPTKRESLTEAPSAYPAPCVKSADRKRHGLSSESIATLTTFASEEVRALTATELHATCANEKDCARLVAALSECVLREGPAAAMRYRNRFVWIGSHPKSPITRQAEFIHALLF